MEQSEALVAPSIRQACRESREGNGGGGSAQAWHATEGEREKEEGVLGWQPDPGVKMALGSEVRGGSARSWQRRAGEQRWAVGAWATRCDVADRWGWAAKGPSVNGMVWEGEG
jgi:hypothetical protein